MTPAIDVLRARGWLAAIDVHFARALGRLGGETRPDVLLAAALVSRRVSDGDVCLDLRSFLDAPGPDEEGHAGGDEIRWPEGDAWLEALRASPLVGDGNAVSPLVLDQSGRLYLRRYWEHQKHLASALRSRGAREDCDVDAELLRDGVRRLFAGGAGGQGPDWQRVAALAAVLRPLAVISGGPGTGKTFTAAKVLALLNEQWLRRRGRPLRAALAAPTGKAAARLGEAIRSAKARLDCSEDVRRTIADDAATIHRRLGVVGRSATRFRHGAGNPLLADVVLVDEASMVDLALMARLTAAVPESARLILLGDKDQLASVEAGAVLGDICAAGGTPSYSASFAGKIRDIAGDCVPEGAGSATAIRDGVVQLSRSYRYREPSGIGALARAINEGDAGGALAILRSGDFTDVRLVEPESGGSFGEYFRTQVVKGFRDVVEASDPAAKLGALEGFRVLCAHRRGPYGVEAVNRRIESALASAGLIERHEAGYAGRPVIVTVNDYDLNLFNGDVGIIVGDGPGKGGAVAFASAAGVRLLSVSRLPPHETALALTVHKSQGSEFDEVAVVLPDEPSPVVTRELLYTAVTRARRGLAVYSAPGVVAHAVAHPIRRASGLREMLRG